MFETTRQLGSRPSWAKAVDQYRRLCDDPQSGPYNRRSALIILQDGLRYAPRFQEIMAAIAESEVPITTMMIQALLQVHGKGIRSTTIETLIITLLDDGMVERESRRRPKGGRHFYYRLSPLGQMLIGEEHKSNGRENICLGQHQK